LHEHAFCPSLEHFAQQDFAALSLMHELPQQEALLSSFFLMQDFAFLPQQDLAFLRMQDAPLLLSCEQHADAPFESADFSQQGQLAFCADAALLAEFVCGAGCEVCAQAAILSASTSAIVLNLM
jgi:hypothetical protein